MSESPSAEPRFPVVVPQGLDGAVVRFGDKLTEEVNRAALALASALEGGAVQGVAEASSALASVYARFDGDPARGLMDLQQLVSEEDFARAPLPGGRRLWRIPAVFGGALGPALSATAAEIGLSEEQAVAELAQTRVRVLALGFAPGQPYLGELPPAWALPRLDDLAQVPEAALAVAIRQMVLFTNGSPTGWRHVGQTAFRCFRPEQERPFALSPGDEIDFAPVTPEALARIREDDASGDGGARWERLP